jgi:hypothetical protein
MRYIDDAKSETIEFSGKTRNIYRGADKSLARPGRKQVTARED